MPEENIDPEVIKRHVGTFRKNVSNLIRDIEANNLNEACLRRYMDLTYEETVTFLRQFNYNVGTATKKVRANCV